MCNVHIMTFTVHFYTLISCVRSLPVLLELTDVSTWHGVVDCCSSNNEQSIQNQGERSHTTQTYSTHTKHGLTQAHTVWDSHNSYIQATTQCTTSHDCRGPVWSADAVLDAVDKSAQTPIPYEGIYSQSDSSTEVHQDDTLCSLYKEPDK